MNKTVAIHISFYNDRWEKMISEGMRALGYEPRFLYDDDVKLEDIQDCEILFGMFPPQLLKECPKLKWLQCSFAGVDKYSKPGTFAGEDVILTNASGSYGITIAEHMICVLLMMMRRMPEYQALIADRGWKIIGDIRSIYDSTVTVVGMGDIGSNFGRRLKAMGATVRGVRRTVQDKPDWCDEAFTTEDLHKSFKGADVVALCVPGTDKTRHILGKAEFDAMDDGTYIINVGRGTAIDQEALYEALKSGKLAGAALDVADPEPLPQDHFLWEAPNLILTPHVSGNMSLPKTCELVIEIFLRNLAHWEKSEPLEHVVDQKQGY